MKINEMVKCLIEYIKRKSEFEFIDFLRSHEKSLFENPTEFMAECEKVLNYGVVYFLRGIFLEHTSNIQCIEAYEDAMNNNCDLAMYQLGMLYDSDVGFRKEIQDKQKAMYYFYMYYIKKHSIKTFMDMYHLNMSKEYCCQFMDIICKLYHKNDKLKEQCREQMLMIEILQKYVSRLLNKN